jgi:O-antigen ligase
MAVVLMPFTKMEITKSKHFLRSCWDILLYFLVLIVGLAYSENISQGFKVLETNLTLIAVPLIFIPLSYSTEEEVRRIFYAFASGLCLASLICLINALGNYFETDNIDLFFFYNLTDVLDFQPTYFAYYIIFAITYSLYLIFYEKTKDYLYIRFASILFLFIVLTLTGGQTSFISLLLIFSFFILKFLVEEKNVTKRITASLVVLMTLGFFWITIIIDNKGIKSLNDSWDRLILWESAIEALPDPVFGVGTGDYKTVLNQYYSDHQMKRFASESFNSHNQLIQLLFSNGLLGVSAFLLMIVRPLYLSYKNENILAMLCFFPFLIYGVTEVFLGRYQGIVFFVFIHQFFMIQLNIARNSMLTKRY